MWKVDVVLSDQQDPRWRSFRAATLTAIVRKKELSLAPEIVSVAATDDTVAVGWKRVSAAAVPISRARWPWWNMWRRR